MLKCLAIMHVQSGQSDEEKWEVKSKMENKEQNKKWRAPILMSDSPVVFAVFQMGKYV